MGSGLIMALAVPLANSIRRNRVKPRATVEQTYGLHDKKATHSLIRGQFKKCLDLLIERI